VTTVGVVELSVAASKQEVVRAVSVAEEVFVPTKPRLNAVGITPVPAWQRRYKILLVVTDVAVVALALAAAQFVRLGRPDVPVEAASAYEAAAYYAVLSYYTVLSLFVGAIWLGLLAG
jgi:hypothetical protein